MSSAQKVEIPSFVEQLANAISITPANLGFDSWFNRLDIQCAYEILAKQFISKITQPTSYGEGRGIVMAGGGAKYYPSLWVNVTYLRALGCELPIEIWYLNEAEMDPIMKKILSIYNVTFKDASEVSKTHPARILNGWELKPYSIIHCPFKEVIFLDADSMPIKDPTILFEIPQYKKAGTIFWPDYPRWTLKPEVFNVFGLGFSHDHMKEIDTWANFDKPIKTDKPLDVPVESGQIVLDKSRCWNALQLTMFFCEHSDYYFKHVHGDKECFHLAWYRTETPYTMPMIWPGWDAHTCLQYGFDGEYWFAHRNQAKWKTNNNSVGSGRIPNEQAGLKLIDELNKRWCGTAWLNNMLNDKEKELSKKLLDQKFFYHRVAKDVRIIQLGENNKITQGEADNEAMWSVFEDDDGRMRLVMLGEEKPTSFLYENKDGVWQGLWLSYEKMPIELVPTFRS
jgi:hypothetical protein